MPKFSINEWFEPVSETDKRQKCKLYAECKFISNDTSSSTGYKWNHFRAKHPKHEVLKHDPQKKNVKPMMTQTRHHQNSLR